MKEFKNPEIETVKIDVEDIITTSDGEWGSMGGEDD